jgi:hypothetical protein
MGGIPTSAESLRRVNAAIPRRSTRASAASTTTSFEARERWTSLFMQRATAGSAPSRTRTEPHRCTATCAPPADRPVGYDSGPPTNPLSEGPRCRTPRRTLPPSSSWTITRLTVRSPRTRWRTRATAWSWPPAGPRRSKRSCGSRPIASCSTFGCPAWTGSRSASGSGRCPRERRRRSSF